jgi:hypothetical protein
MGTISDGMGRYFRVLGGCAIPIMGGYFTWQTLIGNDRFGSIVLKKSVLEAGLVCLAR